MARTGSENLKVNWRGENHQSTVKKSGSYYEQVGSGYKNLGTLSIGTEVLYLDVLTKEHTKAAIQISGKDAVYYTNIDNLIKPKSKSARATALGPASFGLENKTFYSSMNLYTDIQNAINNRNDIGGELFDYLYELLEYAKKGTGDFTGIKLQGFPWGQIQNYYAEVIGPIACIHRGILAGIVPTSGLSSANIYMPPDSEKLYDYKLIVGKNEYLISAKTAKGISNQVKPQFVTSITLQSGKLGTLATTKEFRLLEILGSSTVVAGALYGWQEIQSYNELSTAAIQSIIAVYRGESHTKKLPDPELLIPFVKKHMADKVRSIQNITVGEIRYKCEQLIQNWSKIGVPNTNLKKIFNIYLNESRVIYVKMNVNTTNGSVSFSASAGGGSSLVHSLYLRSSNYASRTADRIGFQVS